MIRVLIAERDGTAPIPRCCWLTAGGQGQTNNRQSSNRTCARLHEALSYENKIMSRWEPSKRRGLPKQPSSNRNGLVESSSVIPILHGHEIQPKHRPLSPRCWHANCCRYRWLARRPRERSVQPSQNHAILGFLCFRQACTYRKLLKHYGTNSLRSVVRADAADHGDHSVLGRSQGGAGDSCACATVGRLLLDPFSGMITLTDRWECGIASFLFPPLLAVISDR